MKSKINRIDILYMLFELRNRQSDDPLSLILDKDASTNGKIYETIFIILVLFKCIPGINYTKIYDGTLDKMKEIVSIKKFLNKPLSQGNNICDLIINNNETIIAFSVKYRPFDSRNSDIEIIENEINNYSISNWKIGFVTKDKNSIVISRIHSESSKRNFLKIMNDNLLFDVSDIKIGIKHFYEKFKSIEEIDSFIINKRKQLILKVHQAMFIKLLIESDGDCCLSNKPRSGKSIIILKYVEHLLKGGIKNKILILTSIKGTIDSFKNDLDTYTDFEGIYYDDQDNFKNIDNLFHGIFFSTIQFFKTDSKKLSDLKKINFDLIVFDECHLGGTTIKSKKILKV